MMHFTKLIAKFPVSVFEIETAYLAAEFSCGLQRCFLLGFNNRRTSFTPKVGYEAGIAFNG